MLSPCFNWLSVSLFQNGSTQHFMDQAKHSIFSATVTSHKCSYTNWTAQSSILGICGQWCQTWPYSDQLISDGKTVTKVILFEPFSNKVTKGKSNMMSGYGLRDKSTPYNINVTKSTQFHRGAPLAVTDDLIKKGEALLQPASTVTPDWVCVTRRLQYCWRGGCKYSHKSTHKIIQQPTKSIGLIVMLTNH